MDLTALDWTIISAYLLFALGVGLYYSKRASQSPEEYYLAGRSLPWWVVGTSIVATTFAADTPLAITEMSRAKGIWENWFWWSWLLYGLLAIFLFSRLWRRAGILTENELIELRYSGKPAAFLRAFKAGYFSILYNFIVLGWVISGMSAVLTVMLGIPKGQTELVIIGLVVLSVVYCLLSGFWGVVMTDLVQFVIAMVGAIALAFISVNTVGGIDGLLTKLDEVLPAKAERLQAEISAKHEELNALAPSTDAAAALSAEIKTMELKLAESPKTAADILSLTPEPPPGFEWGSLEAWTSDSFLSSGYFSFLVFLLVLWWSNHSADGGGYTVQRTMAARDERHAFGANLWYNFACFALRTWPWVVVALVSVVLYPNIQDVDNEAVKAMGEKAGYPLVMKEVLGSGMRGLLIISFLAAFMSTIDTHLNWASSYLVHDIYRRFLARDESDRHYVLVSRVVTVLLMVIAAIVSLFINRIEGAWKFVISMGGGIGLVLILRWFWWRINAWSEIVALGVSVLMAIGFEVLAALEHGAGYQLFSTKPHIGGILFTDSVQLVCIVAVAIVCWVTATLLTKPTDHGKLLEFYKRVQPGGWWAPVQQQVTTTHAPVARGFLLNFVAGIALVWGAMFSIGKLIFKEWIPGLALAAVAVAGWWWIWRFTIVPMKAELSPENAGQPSSAPVPPDSGRDG